MLENDKQVTDNKYILRVQQNALSCWMDSRLIVIL